MPKNKKKKPSEKKRTLKTQTRKKIVKKTVKKTKPARKTVKKAILKRSINKQKKLISEPVIGKVTHYFPHVNAAVIKLKSQLSAGDCIQIKGHTTDFKETVASMQIDHKPVKEAKKGQEIGLLVLSRVRRGDTVYKTSSDKTS